MGAGSSYKMVVDQCTGRTNDSDLDWIAKPPKEGEPRAPPLFEKDLIAGDGPILGKGAYGVTRLSKSSFTGEYYAVKVMNKAPILEKKSVIVVQAEIDTLARMQHPFIVHLFAVHQDDVRCMLVLEYAAGGELLHRIRKRLRLPDGEARFYAAEVADALQYMHNEAGVIYHDLKPENILLAADGHVKVVDFGLALDAEARQWDECRMGTSMYMAPELAKHRVQGAHAPAVDWWSFGCVVYEMLSGKLPFGDSADLSKYEIYTNITEKRLRFGKGFGRRSRGLLKRLLDKNPETRMGWEGVKEHKWFRNVDWEALHNRHVFPPWIPPSMKPGCTQCFLQWKPEAPPGVGAGGAGGGGGGGGGGDQHQISPSDQGPQHECCYARVKVPPGCALRAPPPPPQAMAPGPTRGNGSRDMIGTSSNFQRTVIEPVGGRPSFKNSARAPLAAGRNSSASTGSSGVGSSDHLGATAGYKRGSNDGEGGEGGAGEGGGGGGGGRRSRGASSSTVVGSPGGGNAKRRFKSAAARVAAGDGRYAAVAGGGSHRAIPHDDAVSRIRHRRASPRSSGNGGGAGIQGSAPLYKPCPSVKKQRGVVAYR